MKTIAKLLVRKFASRARIKAALHKANAALAKKTATDRIVAITGYCNDATSVIAEYTAAFANDGRIDDNELDKVNARCDAMVDLYLSDKRVNALIDAIFG